MLNVVRDVFQYNHSEGDIRPASLLGSVIAATRQYLSVWTVESGCFGAAKVIRKPFACFSAPGSSGKTHINLDLAVRVAANLPLPGGSRTPFGRPANVLIVTSENDPERMLRPYLEATARALLKGDDGLVSACLDRIFVLQGTELDLGNGLIVTELLDLSRDRESFRATCRENDIKLTILDPLLSYTGTDVQTIDGLSVRRFLDPLVAVAREQQQTIVATIHFSKRTEGEFISRVMNSRQYTDCARSVLAVLVGLREDDGHVRRWLASAKNNLGPPPAALSFWIESAPHPAFQDEHVSTITWGQARDLDADELDAELKAEREAGRETTRHSAESAAVALQHKLLALWLATPPVEMVTSEELEAWRAEVGVSDRTWTKAKELVGVKTMSTTMRGKWAARLDTIPLLKGLARPSATE